MPMFQQCYPEDINIIWRILTIIQMTIISVPILICILCFLRPKLQQLQRISIQSLKAVLWFGSGALITVQVIMAIILSVLYR